MFLNITKFCHALSFSKMYAVLDIIIVQRLSDSDNCSQLGFPYELFFWEREAIPLCIIKSV